MRPLEDTTIVFEYHGRAPDRVIYRTKFPFQMPKLRVFLASQVFRHLSIHSILYITAT